MIIDEKQDFQSLLTKLPDYFLVQNLSKSSDLKGIPDFSQGSLEDNAASARSFFLENFENLPASIIKEIRKVSTIVDLAGEWTPYKIISASIDLKRIESMNGSSFPVSKYVSAGKTKVTGLLHAHEILKGNYVVATEFKSRSALLRKTYRFLFLTKDNILLVEALEGGKEILDKFLLAKLALSPENLKQKRVNAMVIKRIARKFIPLRLTFLISIETAGVEGLTHITLEGDNVIRGIETLRSRQEYDLDPSNLGPWTAVETETVNVAVRKPIKVKKVNSELFQTLTLGFN
ncbi:MAG: hypothetical protein ACXAEU_14105 [Candidatus Hodarchaeales archaeon]